MPSKVEDGTTIRSRHSSFNFSTCDRVESKHQTSMPKGLHNLLWGAKHVLGVPPRDEKETFARLSWNVRRQPRYTDGHFQFPFGDLRYVDALVLKYQYREIFIQRGYDFACSHDSPLILDCGGNIGLSVVWFKQRYPQSRSRCSKRIRRLLKS